MQHLSGTKGVDTDTSREMIADVSHNGGRDVFLVSADYDGDRRKVYLKFYDPRTEEIRLWYDDTGHLPYCYSREPKEKLMRNPHIKGNKSVLRLEKERKIDALRDKKIWVTKISATDPLAIGGTGFSLREKIDVWEADIKYYVNYLFDRDLQVGRAYKLIDGKITGSTIYIDQHLQQIASDAMQDMNEDEKAAFNQWVEILAADIPSFRRVAFDLEIYTEERNRIPMATHASDPIVSVSFCGSDGLRTVLLYDREGDIEKDQFHGTEFDVEIFRDEKKLVTSALEILRRYPFVVTFNGDSFDLPYFYRRCINLGIPRKQLPFKIGRRDARIEWGVHIDLYRFFFNRSIKGYAFGDKYDVISLNEISENLLGRGKIILDDHLSAVGPRLLVEYSFRDSELTYELTSFGEDLVMRLITTIARVSNMTLDDVCRLSVLNWIKNRVIQVHRNRGYLVPLKEEIKRKGGQRYTKPVTKGKKYVGAIVVKPEVGVHFDVCVVDFSSLYPSIMKEYNISYESVNCPHKECRGTTVPGTGHWVCTLKRGMVSELVGNIRDVRVKVFKHMARSEALDDETREFYNVIQQALKVVLNASYGVFGSEQFPFYYLPAAESVTMYGRHVIQDTLAHCEAQGMKVIYGDTDSLFLQRPEEEQIADLAEWVEKNHRLDLEIDKIYRYVAFSSRKKNYFGVTESGTVDVKGLVGKKKNTPQLIRAAFRRVLDRLREVQTVDDFEEARKDVQGMVREAEEKILRGDFEKEELAISTTLGKALAAYTKTTPQHVKVARLLEREENRHVVAGERMIYLKTTTKPGVKPVEYCNKEEIDVPKYVELLRSTFEQLLDAIGLTLEREAPQYSSLESFM